jgi:hypothetical protein
MNLNCEKCGKLIKHGEIYMSITRYDEYYSDEMHNDNEIVNVVDAEALVILCSSCGNEYTPEKLRQIIDPQLGIIEI